MNTQPFGRTLHVRNVNQALPQVMYMLREFGQPVTSRGMLTYELPGPLLTVYNNPRERMLLDPVRDANPFFHLVDAIWLLSGSRKVTLPCYFLNSLKRFSDDGVTFHGAYGHRIRKSFGRDQLNDVVQLLIDKPDTRQAVISIWDPVLDLGTDTKDMPCNDMVMFRIQDGALNMIVCNRSNDAILGAYGANAVQFSVLQEIVAGLVGVRVGKYVQSSWSMHVYEDNAYWQRFKVDQAGHHSTRDPYGYNEPAVLVSGLVNDARDFLEDCERMAMRAEAGAALDISTAYASTFFRHTVCVMVQAYDLYKAGEYRDAINTAWRINAWDIRMACTDWLERRRVTHELSQAGVPA